MELKQSNKPYHTDQSIVYNCQYHVIFCPKYRYLKRHRLIAGTIKTVTIRRASTGKWWVCFSVEGQPAPRPAADAEVGIDVGLASFATLWTGNPDDTIPNPRRFRREAKALARAQTKSS